MLFVLSAGVVVTYLLTKYYVRKGSVSKEEYEKLEVLYTKSKTLNKGKSKIKNHSYLVNSEL